jgi:hypothetical protein
VLVELFLKSLHKLDAFFVYVCYEKFAKQAFAQVSVVVKRQISLCYSAIASTMLVIIT